MNEWCICKFSIKISTDVNGVRLATWHDELRRETN
jgi:hypothetical protein